MSTRAYLKLVIVAVLLIFVSTFYVGLARATQEDEYLVKAQAVVKKFGDSLKKEFKAAMEGGGPKNAIRICAEKAPRIANRISRKTGWTVHRVSLKVRNPLNRPDEYEYSVLKQFEKQGKDKKNLERHEVVIIQGNKEFRYLRAIKIRPVCLKCHGKADEIAPGVKTELTSKYPHDSATGYAVGQIRGAFSVRIPLE